MRRGWFSGRLATETRRTPFSTDALVVAGSASSLDQKIGSAKGKLDSATAELKQAAAELSAVRTSITEALASNDIQRVRSILGSDPAVLAAALSAPVQLERIAVFPVDNFGSAMAPLYTTLALWIGALLVMVTCVWRLIRHAEPKPTRGMAATLGLAGGLFLAGLFAALMVDASFERFGVLLAVWAGLAALAAVTVYITATYKEAAPGAGTDENN